MLALVGRPRMLVAAREGAGTRGGTAGVTEGASRAVGTAAPAGGGEEARRPGTSTEPGRTGVGLASNIDTGDAPTTMKTHMRQAVAPPLTATRATVERSLAIGSAVTQTVASLAKRARLAGMRIELERV